MALMGVIAATAGASTKAAHDPRSGSDHDRKAAVSKVAGAWATLERRHRQGRREGLRQHPRRPRDGRCRRRTRRHRRRARLDRPARGQRPRAAALPERGDAGAVPRVRARRVLVRHRREEALRRPGRARERRPRRQHEAGQGAEDVRAARERGARVQEEEASNLAIAVQQGANGDAYHMYPFFSGLGGYVFGTNKAGNLDPSTSASRTRSSSRTPR